MIQIEPLERNDASQNQASEDEFRKALLEIFNFRFAVYREVCPTKSLNLITKLFIMLGLKIKTMLNILWMFILYKAFTVIKCSVTKNTTDTNEISKMELRELCPDGHSAGIQIEIV